MSDIEWTDKTWNPMVGCSRVAKSNGRSGCDNCYAEGQANRFAGRYDRPTTIKLGASKRPGLTFVPKGPGGKTLGKGARWTGAVWLLPDVIDAPLRRHKPTTWFVNSQSDVFHESVVGCEEGRQFIAAMFGTMAACPQHTFQVLTKRPEQARAWFEWLAAQCAGHPRLLFQYLDDLAWERPDIVIPQLQGRGEERVSWPLPNVWIGASVEDQESADERIPELLELTAAIRFLSCEPLLGPVVLTRWLGGCDSCEHSTSRFNGGRRATTCSLLRERIVAYGPDTPTRPGECPRPEVHWVIAGGESGPKARECDVAWIESIVEQCRETGTACFVKQLGAKPVFVDERGVRDPSVRLAGLDAKGGNWEKWPEDLRIREMPEVTRVHG